MSDKKGISTHSPAGGIGEGFSISGGKTPPAPSVYPDVDMSGKGASDAAVGHTFGDTDARTAVSVDEVQYVSGVPESYSPSGNDTMVGGLGTPPKP